MDAIIGVIDRSGGTGGSEGRSLLAREDPTPSELRLSQALLRCMGRWGLSKTTIEDIAREAGMSRATAYRLFPGGKSAILDFAARSEVRRLVDETVAVIAAAPDVESCLVGVVHRAACLLEGHDALRYLREHEPVDFERYLAFERVEAIFALAGDLVAPELERFFERDDAREIGVWLARLVLSHLQHPSADLDLTDSADARRLVVTFVVPGIPDPIQHFSTSTD